MSKFVETEFVNTKELLKFPDHYVAMTVMVDDNGVSANADGKKIVPKGTIVGGSSKSAIDNLDEPVVNKFVASVAAQAAKKAALATGTAAAKNELNFTAVTAGAAGNNITIELLDTKLPTADASVAVAGNAITITLKNTTAVAATKGSGGVADNNALTWTSKVGGAAGNDIMVILEDPSGANKELACSVTGHTILVNLATDGASAITSKASDVKAKIEGTPEAHALVSVANTAASSGAGVVVDEVIKLASGADGAIESTAADIFTKLDASDDAKAKVAFVKGADATGVVVAVPVTNLVGGADAVAKADASVTGAEGILLNDVDVTYGDREGAMLLHGFVAVDKLPYGTSNAEAAATAKSTLPMISFIK